MSVRSTPLRAVALATALLAAGTTSARAEDHFLVIGGGAEPSGNQVSLEKNVQLFRTLLGEKYPSGVDHDVYFSDGHDPGRDLQYYLPEDELPRVNLLLARILRQTEDLGESYRSHTVQPVQGASNRANLDGWFATKGQTLKTGDRLVIYATAHGSKGPDDDPHNTTLMLWGRQSLPAKDLNRLIGSLPPGVKVVLVMVQCYSGGFADLALEDRPPGSEVCGFFATTFDRPAAGCTPDIDEENYHEYSSYFWEAIRGRTRTGQPLKRRPDLDGNGRVSFAEAHAYTLLESVTVDIPVKSSDAFLRQFSRTGEGLLSAESPVETLKRYAAPIDRIVIDGLSQTLGLTGPNRAAEARQKAEAVLQAKKKIEREHRDAMRRCNQAAGPIQWALFSRWPELKNRWNPRVAELLTTEADAVVQAIESHPKFAEFEKLRLALEAVEAKQLDQDRLWVKCQRLVQRLESVALAANLAKVADAPTVERYRRLLAAERETIGPPAPASRPTTTSVARSAAATTTVTGPPVTSMP